MPGRDLSRDEPALKAILEAATTIAVFGASPNPSRASNGVMKYLLGRGYTCIPINPGYETILGQPCVPRLGALTQPVDVVDVFRRSEDIPAVADQVLALSWKPSLVFIQLGIRNDAAAARLMDAGIDVVQDRCLYVEHWRLIGMKSPLPDRL